MARSKVIIIGLCLVVIGGFIITSIIRVNAANTIMAVTAETEAGKISNGAAIVNDTTASGAKEVSYQATPQPPTTTPPTSGICGALTTPIKYTHVLWIWEENKDESSVVGQAPYFDKVEKQCASLTNVLDTTTKVSLPSEPQYAAATSGSNCNIGITSNSGNGTGCITNDNDGSSNQLATVSLFQTVKAAGGTWKSYQEGMQSNCAQISGGTGYAFKHNPAAFYTQIRSDCNANDISIAAITCSKAASGGCTKPSNSLTTDITNGTLPTFAFITPNLQNDMHDGTVLQGDNWLSTYLPLIIAGKNYQAGNTAIFIMWDEGSSNSGGIGQIPSAAIAASIQPGKVIATAINNISILRTTEEMLGLKTFLGCSGGTPPDGTGSCNPNSDVSIKAALNL